MKEKQSYKGTIITLCVLVAMTVAMYVFGNYLFGETSVFNQSISSNAFVDTVYHKIPALLKSIQIITVFWLIKILVSCCLSRLLSSFSQNNIESRRSCSSFTR